jgi:hypothetical protein
LCLIDAIDTRHQNGTISLLLHVASSQSSKLVGSE